MEDAIFTGKEWRFRTLFFGEEMDRRRNSNVGFDEFG